MNDYSFLKCESTTDLCNKLNAIGSYYCNPRVYHSEFEVRFVAVGSNIPHYTSLKSSDHSWVTFFFKDLGDQLRQNELFFSQYRITISIPPSAGLSENGKIMVKKINEYSDQALFKLRGDQ